MKREPLKRTVKCPCGAEHVAVATLAGWPLVKCPAVKGDMLRFSEGFTLFRVGEGK